MTDEAVLRAILDLKRSLGVDEGYVETVEIWDPRTLSGTKGVMVEHARTGHTAVLSRGRFLVAIGGLSNDGLFQDSFSYWDLDAQNVEREVGELAKGRAWASSSVLADGRVVVAGGLDLEDASITVETWSPQTRRSTLSGRLRERRAHHTSVVLPSGLVLLSGGFGSEDQAHASSELWDPAALRSEPGPEMLEPRTDHTATLLPDGMVLIIGGFAAEEGPRARGAEIYDPVSGSVRPAGRLIVPRGLHRANLLPDGRVVVTGGTDEEDVRDVEIWEPLPDGSGRFLPGGSLNVARAAHSAVTLADGRIVIAGGCSNSADLSSIEIYDADDGTSEEVDDLRYARSSHTATLLPNGRIFFVGGLMPFGAGESDEEDEDEDDEEDEEEEDWEDDEEEDEEEDEEDWDDEEEEDADPEDAEDEQRSSMIRAFIDGLIEDTRPPGDIAQFVEVSELLASGFRQEAGFARALAQWSKTHRETSPQGMVTGSYPLPGPDALRQRFREAGSMLCALARDMDAALPDWAREHGSEQSFDSWLQEGDAGERDTATFEDLGGLGDWGRDPEETARDAVRILDDLATWIGEDAEDPRRERLREDILWWVAWCVRQADEYGVDFDVIGEAHLFDVREQIHGIGIDLCRLGSILREDLDLDAIERDEDQGEDEEEQPHAFIKVGELPPSGRRGHRATLLPDGRVLISGGRVHVDGLNETVIWGPADDDFADGGDLADARSDHSATLLPDGRVLVAGGWNGTDLGSAEVWDGARASWQPAGHLAVPRAEHTATALGDGRVLIVGGEDDTPIAEIELWYPTGAFTPAGRLLVARVHHSATRLADGRVLIAGGSGPDGELVPNAELWDPSTQTVRPAGTLHVPRARHAAALLPDGRVLLGGGEGQAEIPGFETWDPATEAFTRGAEWDVERSDHAMTVLPDGRVIITSGWDDGDLLTSEIWDPSLTEETSLGSTWSGRAGHEAVLLPDGRVVLFGGWDGDEAVEVIEAWVPEG